MVNDAAGGSPDAAAFQSGRSPFIERIIEASARNKFLVFILTVFGIAAAFRADQERRSMPFPI